MPITLVRHAVAIDKQSGLVDDYRYLTVEGRNAFRKTARNLRRNGVCPSVIVTSPLVRAVQTAEILSEVLEFTGPLLVRKELVQGKFHKAQLKELVAALRCKADDDVVLVGHDPDFSALGAKLLGKDEFHMKKGAALRLKVDPDGASAQMVWMAHEDDLTEQPDTKAT